MIERLSDSDNQNRHDRIDSALTRAWRKITGESVWLDNIQLLKGAPRPHHSQVYRISGIGPAGTSVIAKRCTSEIAAAEGMIYEKILARLALPALRCFGLTPDDDNELYWIFLEDAGEEKYSSEREEHQVMAGCWLATLHSCAIPAPVAASLPDRTAGFYLETLRRVRDSVIKSFDIPTFSSDNRAVLRSILSSSDQLEALWGHVQKFCDRIPLTVVHGDMAEKNLRVRHGPGGNSLLVLDWEMGGWGVPAADLRRLNPDMVAYWSIIQSSWPNFDPADLQRLINLGELFRLITALFWAVPSKWEVDRAQWYIERMRCYEPRLAALTRTGELGLSVGLA